MILSKLLSPEPPELDPKRAIVRCTDDYERATQRIAELGNVAAGSPEAELVALIDAVEKWDARHDDASSWD